MFRKLLIPTDTMAAVELPQALDFSGPRIAKPRSLSQEGVPGLPSINPRHAMGS